MTDKEMRAYVQQHGLASCPFCGGPAVHESETHETRTTYNARCLSCAAVGPWCKSGKEGAARLWNRRARQIKVKPTVAPAPR